MRTKCSVLASDALKKVNDGIGLSIPESLELFIGACWGHYDDRQLRNIVATLQKKGETASELLGAVKAFRVHRQIYPQEDSLKCLDLCGTGGDRLGLFNVSTCAAFVVAACGVKVIKHGGVTFSSTSGSSNVLNELGILPLTDPRVIARTAKRQLLTFVASPSLESSSQFRRVRESLAGVTIFNLVAPFLNPVLPKTQLIGVPNFKHASIMAKVTKELGYSKALIVSGHAGEDEVSILGESHVFRFCESVNGGDGSVNYDGFSPKSLGLEICGSIDHLKVSSPAESAQKLKMILGGQKGPLADMVALNAAFALFLAERVPTLKQGLDLAQKTIKGGRPAKLLLRLQGVAA